MKPFPVALQLYSVREEAKHDLLGTLRKVADFGYPGVELAGMYDKTPGELRKIFDDLGLEVVSSHSMMPTAENRSEVVDMAGALGNAYHVCGRGRDRFATAEMCVETGREFQRAAEALKGTGIQFGVHNHWWEFSNRFDGRSAHEIAMAEAPDAFAQIDTYWAATGGADTAEVIRSLGPRVPLLHIKDGPLDAKKSMTAVGDGRMDWKSVMAAVDESVLTWIIVEIDRVDGNMLEAVERSVKYLIDIGFGAGRG
jgi:sugar phosphate isomerase/epimerase